MNNIYRIKSKQWRLNQLKHEQYIQNKIAKQWRLKRVRALKHEQYIQNKIVSSDD